MIDWLRWRYTTWGQVYLAFSRLDGEIRPIEGWYISFDGPKLSDCYLTNKHPMGDESGKIITINDFNDKNKDE